MSQQRIKINEEIVLTMPLTIKIEGFSNHNGFTQKQIENAVEEFKQNILDEIENKICKNYYSEEFLKTVDFVNYEIKLNK